VKNKELEFTDWHRSEIQRKNVKRLVSSLPKPGNMQYGDCPKETMVAGQADVSLRNEGAGARKTLEGDVDFRVWI
jgi:hypothetical protein